MHKSTCFIIFLSINANLGAFFFGYQIGVLNMGQDTVDYKLGITTNVIRALVNASVPLGALFGSVFSSHIMKNTSRKWSLVISDGIGIIGCLMTLFGTLETFFAYRIIAGFSVGLNSALVPIYVTEFSPVALKGVTGSINGIFIPFGILISYLLGLGYDKQVSQSTSNYWLFVFIFPSIVIFVRTLLLLLVFRDDPPLHHVERENHDKAKEVLGKIYHEEHIHRQYYCVYEQHQQNQEQQTSYKKIFQNKNVRHRLHIGCLLQIIQQTSGIVAVIFYSNKIFNNATSERMAFWLSCIFTVLLMLTALVSGILLKYFGRKQILIVGQIIVITFEIILAVSSYFYDNNIENKITQILIIASIYGFTLGYGISIGPIVWLYNAEILPDKGVSLTVLTNWVMVIAITFVFPIVVEALGTMWPIFAFFAICVSLGLIFTVSKVKETKGLNPQQIEGLFGVVGVLGNIKEPLIPTTSEGELTDDQNKQVKKD